MYISHEPVWFLVTSSHPDRKGTIFCFRCDWNLTQLTMLMRIQGWISLNSWPDFSLAIWGQILTETTCGISIILNPSWIQPCTWLISSINFLGPLLVSCCQHSRTESHGRISCILLNLMAYAASWSVIPAIRTGDGDGVQNRIVCFPDLMQGFSYSVCSFDYKMVSQPQQHMDLVHGTSCFL